MLDTEKLRKLRLKKKLTIEGAAQLAGFASRQQWYNIESGRRADVKLSTLDALARAVGAKPHALIK